MVCIGHTTYFFLLICFLLRGINILMIVKSNILKGKYEILILQKEFNYEYSQHCYFIDHFRIVLCRLSEPISKPEG